ncbi:MAG: hypothetical protein CMQ05_02920 [Gammaproteobacteria bacterium]|uniref:Regulatory protein RecX n=1 Tax=OM182 bacterium MED-G24 TaxID=1986255 RepID=A0A2A5WYF2_9GAMM|nr:hypothetical protein [Gammaproteobacteria bacterium]PDH41303.1 MAG: hypothetical protein CNE99_02095 [OM182 bacterium MED-G24]
MSKLMSLRRAAMDLLARREHSRAELRKKLCAKLWRRFSELDPGDIDDVLDQLAADGLLSEQRALSSFVRERVRRGQGPIKILFDARQRGFDSADVEAELEVVEIDWIASASDVLHRRFGNGARSELAADGAVEDAMEATIAGDDSGVTNSERRQSRNDRQIALRKEQARRYRFLTQRGFTGDQITEVIRGI